jgi:hypothetical protein
MLLMYARLYYILYKAHHRFAVWDIHSSSTDPNSATRSGLGNGSAGQSGQNGRGSDYANRIPRQPPKTSKKLKKVSPVSDHIGTVFGIIKCSKF